MWRCVMCIRRIPLLSLLFMITANWAYAVDFNGEAANYNLNAATINNSSARSYQVAGLQFLPDFTDSEFGWHGSSISNDYSSGTSCPATYTLDKCPDNASCDKCAFDTKYKMNGCADGYKQDGDSCTPQSCDKINAAYKSDVPSNQSCSVVSGLSIKCYQNCTNISCSDYGLASCPSNANCGQCPDCSETDSHKGNCSPDKLKVVSCKNTTQKVNAGATACIDKDDTCPAGYNKSCDTGTVGDPKYTEKGTACYQCKAAPCSDYPYTGSCPNKYYTSEKCPTDTTKLKCTATCGSKIVDAHPDYKIDEYNSGVTVITKDGTYLPSGSTVYSNINFPEIAECAALPKPTITQTLSNGRQGSLSVGRIENINFIYNFQPWTEPEYCSKIKQIQSAIYDSETFCSYSCSPYNSYDLTCKTQCNNPGVLDAYGQNLCQLIEDIEDVSGSDACYYLANSNTDTGCTNSNASPSLALELYPTQTTSNSFGNDAKINNIGYLKNVDITVNGSPNAAIEIGGGAWVNKTIVFEGTNTVKGGSKYTFWIRGHNSGSYGHVKGVLQVAGGAKLTTGPVCEYTQWNGLTQKYGTLSGTVNTNCSTYTLKW